MPEVVPMASSDLWSLDTLSVMVRPARSAPAYEQNARRLPYGFAWVMTTGTGRNLPPK